MFSTNELGRHGPAPPSYDMRECGQSVTIRDAKTLRLAASALVLFALAGCSGGVKASAPQSPVDMGKMIGCDATQQSPTMFAREEV
jgi:hypothetical protein